MTDKSMQVDFKKYQQVKEDQAQTLKRLFDCSFWAYSMGINNWYYHG